jgi:hypothetical protein
VDWFTDRLRDKLAIAASNRSIANVAAEYGVSWLMLEEYVGPRPSQLSIWQ